MPFPNRLKVIFQSPGDNLKALAKQIVMIRLLAQALIQLTSGYRAAWFFLVALTLPWLGCRFQTPPNETQILADLAANAPQRYSHVTHLHALSDFTLELLLTKLLLPATSQFGAAITHADAIQNWLANALKQDPNSAFYLALFEDKSGELIPVHKAKKLVPNEAAIFFLDSPTAWGLVNLDRFLVQNARLPRRWFEWQVLAKSLNSDRTVARIQQIIRESTMPGLTEVGGFVTITQPDTQLPELEFYPLHSDSTAFIVELQKVRDQPERVLALITSQAENFSWFETERQQLLRELPRYQDPEAKAQRLDLFLDTFFSLAKLSYFPSQAEFHERAMNGGITGYYFSGFHVHPFDDLPSYPDRMASWLNRNLIITPTLNGFDLYYLFYGSKPREGGRRISYSIESKKIETKDF